MAYKNSYNSFGEYFTAIMRDRGFMSDEQLARRAMQIQEQLTPRVNVQRRTINNWRNDKSTPRSLTDLQFKLVASALKLSDDEISSVSQFMVSDITSKSEPALSNEVGADYTPKLPWKWISFGLAFLILLVGTVFILVNSDIQIIYLEDIPPTQLRVSETGFVIPNSDTQVVNEQQFEKLSGWELYVARNEIFARRGRPFVKSSSMCLQNHFNSWAKTDQNPDGWYIKKSGDVRLTDLEYRNAEIIRNFECKVRGGQYNCSGQLNQCY